MQRTKTKSLFVVAAAALLCVGCSSGGETRSDEPVVEQASETVELTTQTAEPEPDPEPAEFDARLSLYDYPFDVATFEVEAQRQTLEMAYMDLRPEESNGKVALLLHGKNFSGAYWERTARDLADRGYRVLMPDQIGFGKSSKPRHFQFSFAALAHHTRELARSLGIENATVVGHSMGGMLATRFALMHPGFTEKLVLVNPIGLEDWSEKVPYVPIEAVYESELQKTPDKVQAYMKQSYFDGQWKPEYDALAEIQAEWTESRDRELLAWVSALTYDMIFTQPVVHEFGRLKVPTLLIIGTRDRTALGKGRVSTEVRETLGRYERLGDAARDAIPDAKLVEMDDVGHIPQFEAYDAYFDALTEFLDRE